MDLVKDPVLKGSLTRSTTTLISRTMLDDPYPEWIKAISRSLLRSSLPPDYVSQKKDVAPWPDAEPAVKRAAESQGVMVGTFTMRVKTH